MDYQAKHLMIVGAKVNGWVLIGSVDNCREISFVLVVIRKSSVLVVGC